MSVGIYEGKVSSGGRLLLCRRCAAAFVRVDSGCIIGKRFAGWPVYCAMDRILNIKLLNLPSCRPGRKFCLQTNLSN